APLSSTWIRLVRARVMVGTLASYIAGMSASWLSNGQGYHRDLSISPPAIRPWVKVLHIGRMVDGRIAQELRVGGGGGRGAHGLHGRGRHVLARGLPAADDAGHGLVAGGHLQRHDPEFPHHGRRRLRLGGAQRPLWRAYRGAGGRRAARARDGAREPGGKR